MASKNNISDFIWPYVEPPIYEPLWFENFDVVHIRNWMEMNWSISLYICAAYISLVFLGRHWMKNKPAYDLRTPLALWNLSMAIFSIFGLCRCTPELLYVLNGKDGFFRSICVRDNHTQASAFWAWAFTLSKVVELGDTAFIILRKKQLMFVHYYHHAVALVVCWCYYSDYEPIARWFGICNFAVHTVLYTYLCLKTLEVSLPRILAKFVIFIELAQMIVGIVVNSYAISMKAKGIPCARSTEGIFLQMLVYSSFVILFVYLFAVNGSNQAGKKKKEKSS